ncbi:oxamate carbamoyltransferase subunit AllH family protein [Mariniluteicoccus flavus]
MASTRWRSLSQRGEDGRSLSQRGEDGRSLSQRGEDGRSLSQRGEDGRSLSQRGEDCVVVAAFPTAAYLKVGDAHDDVLALLRPDALQIPGGVRLEATAPDLRTLLAPGDVGTVDRDRVRVGGLEVAVTGTWKSARVRRHVLAASGNSTNVLRASGSPSHVLRASASETRSLRPEPALRAEARDLAAALTEGRTDGLDALIGRGTGLTPSGDDAVCGVALALVATDAVDPDWLARELASRATRTTSLSARLLACAAQGYAVPQVVALVDELLDPCVHTDPGPPIDPPVRLAARVRAVHAIGHSSGRDLCAGIAGAVDHLSSQPVHV